MSGVIDSIERAQLRRVPLFQAGDRLRVHFQVVEGTRRRTQIFEGIVIKRQGSGARETFTVRKQSFGVGVERTFPLHSPKIERIEVAGRGDVRRAKLYYLRDRVGRGARVRERRFTGREEEVWVEGIMPPPEADITAPGTEEAGEDLAPDPRDEGVEEVIEAEHDEARGDEAAADGEEAGAEGDEAGAEGEPREDAPAGEEQPREEATEGEEGDAGATEASDGEPNEEAGAAEPGGEDADEAAEETSA